MGKLSRIPHDFCQWWFRQNADKSSKLPEFFLLSKKQRIKFKVAPDLNWRNITNHKHWTKSQISSAAAHFQWGFYKKTYFTFSGCRESILTFLLSLLHPPVSERCGDMGSEICMIQKLAKLYIYIWYIIWYVYFTNPDFPETRGFPFLSYILRWGRIYICI